MTARRKPGEQQIGRRRKHRAQKQHTQNAEAQRQRATDERARQRHDDAVELRHGGDFVLAVAHVDIERVRHDPHDDVRDSVHRDQRKQQQRGSGSGE